MTLPFRRRHNDAEASHDRARAIMGTGFFEATEPADDQWLETHLAGCPECRADLVAYQADRELLRTLRENAPEPPRDLWARTAASIEREAGRQGGSARVAGPSSGGRRLGRLPLGVMSGVLVILVVIGTSLFPRNSLPPIGNATPGNSDVAVITPAAEATPLLVTANAVTWVQARADGTYELVSANVDEVCTNDPEACAPIEDTATTRITLPGGEPESAVMAPGNDQVAVVPKASSSRAGEVIVIPVPTPAPTDGETPAPTDTPAPTPIVTPTPTLGPDDSPQPSIVPTQSPDPNGSFSILTGVTVVGEAAYSPDGRWLAFSARPLDGTTGPDLYTWHVGDFQATAVTADHRTFFAAWLGTLILASRVEPADGTDPLASPDASGAPGAPTATPAPTAKPGRTQPPAGGPKATPKPGSTIDPLATPGASAPPEDHPVSFLLDPLSEAVIDLAGHDIWRPVVDTESQTILYWSGTLVRDEAGTGWAMGTGSLVLDRWIDPAAPDPTPDPSATPTAEPTLEASIDPLASLVPTPPPGPAGTPEEVAVGPISDFEASFDPSGTRLAVWVLDPTNPDVGTLRLIAIDPLTGVINPEVDPLPSVAAMRGFSIDEGRLAWVTPPGQDGDSSHVHVLAWHGDEFGQVRSIAADRFFVVR